MKKKIRYMSLAVSLVMLSAFAAQGVDDKLVGESKQALDNFHAKDSSLKNFVGNAAGFAIFPSVGKGGFIVGGAHGDGLVYEKGGKLIGEAKMTQASIGAQAGGQTFSQLIVFQTPETLNNFKASNFEMSAEVSAVAAAEGAAQSASYKQGVAVFTLPKKGLMVSASIGGQKFKFEPILQPTGPDSNKQ
jgi:lipid-binding SYLF domain-containing protein